VKICPRPKNSVDYLEREKLIISPMVNSELLRKLVLSDLDPRDREEIIRIFDILPDDRKIAILEEWDSLADRIRENRRKIEEDKKIFMIRSLEKLEQDLAEYEQSMTA
jgi:hypothetical protein